MAQEQRQWPQAEQYYQQALQIKIEFNDRYEQAGTYHQLGSVAQEQRQWPQAEQYYQQALQIKIEFNDRYAQATPTTSWAAWRRSSASGPRPSSTTSRPCKSTSSSTTATPRPRPTTSWAAWRGGSASGPRPAAYVACGHAVSLNRDGLQIGVEFKDEYRIGTRLQSLAGLWRASEDATLPAAVGQVLGVSAAEAEKLLAAAAEN